MSINIFFLISLLLVQISLQAKNLKKMKKIKDNQYDVDDILGDQYPQQQQQQTKTQASTGYQSSNYQTNQPAQQQQAYNQYDLDDILGDQYPQQQQQQGFQSVQQQQGFQSYDAQPTTQQQRKGYQSQQYNTGKQVSYQSNQSRKTSGAYNLKFTLFTVSLFLLL